MKSLRLIAFLMFAACGSGSAFAQTWTTGQIVAVFPFENKSSAPGLQWIGDAFPELVSERLSSQSCYVLGREERLRAYDRTGIPASLHPSRATLYRIAQQMDVDFAVLGEYTYDGQTFSTSAQLLDMQREKLLPPSTESGPLTDLINIQTRLAWDLLRGLQPEVPVTREAYLAAFSPVRLDVFENYIRGVIATSNAERIAYLRAAVRINPSYGQAWLQLGKTHYDAHQYDQAISDFSQVSRTAPSAREANFYLGLAAYYQGNFAKAEAAFGFVATTLPLAEVYNNLGVVAARREKKGATEFFQHAVQSDPKDADYRFNLAVSSLRVNDLSGASRQLREALALRPNDTEAKALYDRIAGTASAKTQNSGDAYAFGNLPLERIKRNYEENSFRQLVLQIQAVAEQRLSKTDSETHARFHVGRGQELLSRGFVAEADKEFREAAALDPQNAQALAGLARVMEDDGDMSGARSQAEAALRLQ